ncbi:MAG: PilZ domain-containing protein [bacterium]
MNLVSLTVSGIICVMSIFLIFILYCFITTHFRPKHENPVQITLQQKNWEERRQHPRIGIQWPVRIETSGGAIDGVTRDISLGGAFICCNEPLPLRETFSLILASPNFSWSLEVTGEVVWSNANVPADKIVNRGMGVRFIHVSKETRAFINQAISDSLHAVRF